MNTKLASAKSFVQRNQTKILVTITITSIGVAALSRIGLAQRDEFLRDHGLMDEFWAGSLNEEF